MLPRSKQTVRTQFQAPSMASFLHIFPHMADALIHFHVYLTSSGLEHEIRAH